MLCAQSWEWVQVRGGGGGCSRFPSTTRQRQHLFAISLRYGTRLFQLPDTLSIAQVWIVCIENFTRLLTNLQLVDLGSRRAAAEAGSAVVACGGLLVSTWASHVPNAKLNPGPNHVDGKEPSSKSGPFTYAVINRVRVNSTCTLNYPCRLAPNKEDPQICRSPPAT